MAALPAGAKMFGPAYQPCRDRPNKLAIVECVQEQTKASDQRLNAAYMALQARIDPAQRRPLLAAQPLWVQYRDANCGLCGAQERSTRQVQRLKRSQQSPSAEVLPLATMPCECPLLALEGHQGTQAVRGRKRA